MNLVRLTPNQVQNHSVEPLAAHVVARPIERDLTPVTRSSLHRVPCAAPSATRSCFAAGR
jgi:hypothetical protein